MLNLGESHNRSQSSLHTGQAVSITHSLLRGPSAVGVFAKASQDARIPFVALVTLWVVSLCFIPGFRSGSHVMYIMKVSSFLGIVAAGQTLVMTTGGIDISVSGAISLSAVVCAQLIATSHLGAVGAIAVSLLVSLGIGIVNGLGILMLGLPPLVMTLAMLSMIEGGLLIYTSGAPVSGRSPLIDWLGNGTLIPAVPNPILIWIVISAFTMWLLHYSKYGRYIHAVGTNQQASHVSGVSIRNTVLLAYALSGLLAGVAGILILGYVSTTYLTMGVPYQMGSIAAVVIGGTSNMGGKGTYIGSFVGSILLTLTTSVLTVIKMPEGLRQAIYGALIIGVFIAYVSQNSSSKT
jgi:ribose transport system permease protein